MSGEKKTFWTETLPERLPQNPLEVAAVWLDDARRDAAQPNPNAMVLATADALAVPSARVVLCKSIDAHRGFITFYTNYRSRKGVELAANPRAAVVFHWDQRHRQVRIEGRVEMMSEADSDAYFDSRAWQSRLGAWASQQSQPVASRAALTDAVAKEAARLGIPYDGPGAQEPERIAVDVPRPTYWGGFKLHAQAVELWVEGEFRIHDRARWTRNPPAAAVEAHGVHWTATRLQP